MKKKLSLILALTLILTLLCGCGGNAKSNEAYDAYNSYSYSGGYYEETKAAADYGWVSAPGAPADAPMAAPVPEPQTETKPKEAAGSNLPANVKLIYTADIDMESTEFDSTLAALDALVSDLGGYYERSELQNYGNYRHGYYTVRVPAEYFTTFCEGVGGLCQVNSISKGAKDVSEAYYDLESRLTTQRTKLSRLQELLEKAEIMEDIITLESAISETELAIEQLTGSLRKYDSLVGYSTITIVLDEVYKLTPVEQPVIGFGAKLIAAFKSGCSRFVDNCEDFLIGFARAWVGWLIFIIIVVVVFLLIRRGVRRGRERRGARVSKPTGRTARKAAKQVSEEIPAATPSDMSEDETR